MIILNKVLIHLEIHMTFFGTCCYLAIVSDDDGAIGRNYLAKQKIL